MPDKRIKHSSSEVNPAVNLIRARIDTLYGHEPSVEQEIKEVNSTPAKLSKHQTYMKQLNESGKSMADIQTEWHKYYQSIPDNEKRQVWQEFYDASERAKADKSVNNNKTEHDSQLQTKQTPQKTQVFSADEKNHKQNKNTFGEAKSKIRRSVSKNHKAKLSAKAHFKSLLFGLSMGFIVLLVLLFSFFNERFIAPFITPSKNVSSMPIIIDPGSTEAGPENLVIIPKINVEVPVVYNTASIQEKDIQNGLENGVVHYITTPNPGEQGNSVVVGHSSNNILNKGKYKFAFVLLNKLEIGDTFSMTKNNKRYVYRVYKKEIVKPTDTSVLGSTDKASTVTLITCDPPGTSINRLIIVGEQISPDPTTNVASTAKPESKQPSIVPGNSPTLWSRLTGWLFS